MTIRSISTARPLGGLWRLWTAALDLVFPPRCAACGRVDTTWCSDCQARLQAEPLDLRRQALPPLSEALACGIHAGIVQHAIHVLKYEGQTQVGETLAQRMVAALHAVYWPVTLIVPVPLHASRQAKRGYNQSQILGDILGQTCSIPCQPQAIARHRETHTQVGLNREGRLLNVKDAFSATLPLTGQHLLLVDDVRTTGATLLACAEAALAGGAAAVYALTLTVAQDT
jgi:ComF family protein